MSSSSQPERWTSRTGFILATVGSAVGIGSIWKFPYEVGANGGGAFVLFYLLGIALVVLPFMVAEFAIGRRGGGDVVSSIANVARAHGASLRWSWIGALGMLTAFLILSYYCVIGGWTLSFALDTTFQGLPGTRAELVQQRYDQLLRAPVRMAMFTLIFIAAAIVVVVRGVARGIEAVAKVLMPLLAALLLILAVYGLVEGDAPATARYLFTVDWSKVTARAVLEALGLGFFSIGVGMGMMITYAAYSDARLDLKEIALVSVAADTLISLLAGFAVFPLVFAHGLNAAAGPGLVFVSLPLAFADMPLGSVMAVGFFLLLFVAALSSTIATFELLISPFVQRRGWSRQRAGWLAGGACFLAGIPTILSFNLWADWHPLAGWNGFQAATFYDLVDFLTSNCLLPMGGLLLSIFAGWVISDRVMVEELGLGPAGARALRLLLRYLAPLSIIAISLGQWID